MKNIIEKQIINRLMGRKTITSKKIIVPAITPYPIRRNPLGRSSGSVEGVGRWRSNYHRPDHVKLDGSDFSGSYLSSLRENKR